MRQRWRWAIVLVGCAVLASLPFAARLLPGGDSTIAARTLLHRIEVSTPVAYSGYAQSQGGLALPVGGGNLSAISDLFGGTSQLRVWWRGDDDWRVDTLSATGESDVHRDGGRLSTWDYESDTARVSPAAAAVRTPRADDLVPANLARRLLSEVDPASVYRLPGARVAGHETGGLRVVIDDPRSTITHIDVWALPSNGLPVRVAVYGSDPTPLVSTSFLDLDVGAPSAGTIAFRPTSGQGVEFSPAGDIVSAIDRFGDSRPPAELAGLRRRRDLDLGAVGVYGRGVTLLVAVPLTSDLAGQIVPALRRTPGVIENASGITAGAGALNLQLSPPVGFGDRWLLAGTVTRSTLRQAAAQLPPPRGFAYFRFGARLRQASPQGNR